MYTCTTAPFLLSQTSMLCLGLVLGLAGLWSLGIAMMMLSAHTRKPKENGGIWLPVDFTDLKWKRNKVTNLMNKTREEFYSKFIEDNATNQRKLFCTAKKLLGTSTVLNFPVHLDKTVLANDVSKLFVCKVERICQNTDSICLSSADPNLVPPDREALDVPNSSK